MQGKCVSNKIIKQFNSSINCSSKPCLNGGTCLFVSNFFICFCPYGYNGFYF